MATLSELQARREALEKALASGHRRVEYDGNSVEYRSVAEIRSALSVVSNDIARLSGARRRKRIFISAARGY